jgi:GMP synthase (glutamine-hydrolysing)
MMHRWVVHGAERFSMPNAQVGRDHLEGRMIFDAPLKEWLWNFLDLVFDPQVNGAQAAGAKTGHLRQPALQAG